MEPSAWGGAHPWTPGSTVNAKRARKPTSRGFTRTLLIDRTLPETPAASASDTREGVEAMSDKRDPITPPVQPGKRLEQRDRRAVEDLGPAQSWGQPA